MKASTPTSSRGLRAKEAAERLGCGISTLKRWAAKRPDFPRPRRLSARCTVYMEHELQAWVDAQAAAAKGQA